MAEVVTLKSDLTGALDSPQDPVRARDWGWEGQRLRSDLSDTEYEKFRQAVAPYLAASRPQEDSKTRTVGRRANRDTDGAKAKAWARGHGAELGDGRAPNDVIEAWQADDPTMLGDRIKSATNGHAVTGASDE